MEMQFLGQLASTGLVGVLLVLALLALRSKDRELRQADIDHAVELKLAHDERIADAKAYLALAMTLQKEVIAAVSKLADIVEIFERRESDRDRREAREDARRP